MPGKTEKETALVSTGSVINLGSGLLAEYQLVTETTPLGDILGGGTGFLDEQGWVNRIADRQEKGLPVDESAKALKTLRGYAAKNPAP